MMQISPKLLAVIIVAIVASAGTATYFLMNHGGNSNGQIMLDKCTMDIVDAESVIVYDQPQRSEDLSPPNVLNASLDDSNIDRYYIFKKTVSGTTIPAKIHNENGKEIKLTYGPRHMMVYGNILFMDFFDERYSIDNPPENVYRSQLYAINMETGKIYLILQTNSAFSDGYSAQICYLGQGPSKTYLSLCDGDFQKYNGIYSFEFENDNLVIKQISPIIGTIDRNCPSDVPFHSSTRVYEDDSGRLIYYKDGQFYIQSENMGIINGEEYKDLGFGICKNIQYSTIFPTEVDKLHSDGTLEHIVLTERQSYESAIYLYLGNTPPMFTPSVGETSTVLIYRDKTVTIGLNKSVAEEPIDVNQSTAVFLQDVAFTVESNSVDIFDYRSLTNVHVNLVLNNIAYLKENQSFTIGQNAFYKEKMIEITGVTNNFDTVKFRVYSTGVVSFDLDRFQPTTTIVLPLN